MSDYNCEYYIFNPACVKTIKLFGELSLNLWVFA